MGSSSKQRAGGGVRWKSIFYHQTWGALVVLVVAGVIIGCAHFLVEPAVRPLRMYDASIALPLKGDTVSITAAGLVPAAALLVTVLLVEFAALHKKQSLTMAIHAAVHIILWAIVGFAVVLAITEATKPFASRFRPDYMSRCKPANTRKGQPLALDVPVQCTGSKGDDLDDGRKSFPSGHSSNSMSLCWFTVLYFVHALYWRQAGFMGGLWAKRGCGSRLLMELAQGLFIIWGLGVLVIAWCIGVSRYRDNRHNIDDILGGFMVSLLWMTPVVFIALGQLNWYQRQLAKEEAAEAEQGLEAGGSNATLPVVNPDSAAAAVATPAAAPSSRAPPPATLQTLVSQKGGKGVDAAAAARAGVNGGGAH